MKFRFLTIALVLCVLRSSPVPAADSPTPRPPWKLDLIASAPEIRHPSVVCAAPDGRVFVAEDPMDISAPADAPHGRIITFHPDGRRTIFATNLFAVFGLQYLEGKLYVLHNPRFTVFHDSGDFGTAPEDLIKSTNPNPWALDWNDHVPANFRLAMDGYFYMAVGDKGIYGATGRDGRKVFLHGGGILRIRPDGTGMEVYATGVRNILDVALTSEDEIFTYDNTDEHDWMGRLTHIVDGGFYGYPHHFNPPRPYSLWMMHDFGGGAATGAFANTEDALPPEYRDNLFLADFGKRQIIRVIIERDGATFKVVRHEELFSEMPDSFRPVGIAPSHDGKSIYICDWQHRDTKENVEVGRLWKLTYTDKTFEQPKPFWYVSTALGKKSDATDQQLSDALSHPSKNVRLTAQRELSRRRVLPLLPADAPLAAHWHSLWAYPHVPQGLTQLSLPKDSSLKRQQLRVFTSFPASDAQTLAIGALKDSDASVRFQAATALGRLKQDPPKSIQRLLWALPESDLFTRHAIENALNRIARGNPNAWRVIVPRLIDDNPAIRASVTHAMRETYDPALAQALSALARDQNAPGYAREAALQSLAGITRKLPEWKGEWWAYHPALAPAPIKTVPWEATDSALALFNEILGNEPELRLATIRSLTEAHETALAPTISALYFEDHRTAVREAILQALAKFKDTNSAPVVAAALTNSATEIVRAALGAARFSGSPAVYTNLAALVPNTRLAPDLRADVIRAVGNLRLGDALESVAAATKSEEITVRSAAINALGKIGGRTASQALLSLFDLPEPAMHLLAVNALGELADTNAVPKLLTAYTKDITRDAALDALLRIPDLTAVDVYLDALGHANPATRERARKVLEPFRERIFSTVRARVETMRPIQIAEIQKLYPDDHNLILISREKTIPTAADYLNAGLQRKGDTHRGRRIFHDQTGVACISCHTVAGHGHAVGPDMTTIGTQFSRVALVEHIMDPSKAVREGYQQVLIETSDDENLTGLIKSETADSLTILTAQAQLHTISKSKITVRQNSQLSLMPDGLHLGLALDEFADLIAYLESLKVDPRATKE